VPLRRRVISHLLFHMSVLPAMLEVLFSKPKIILRAAFLLTFLLTSGRAMAEVRITGSAESMDVEAKDALLLELFSALHDKFGLSFQSTAPLDKMVTGSFHGSLEQVVFSVLFFKNYSYVYQKTDHPFLQILGADRSVASLSAAASPAPSPSPDQRTQCADQPQARASRHISAKYLNAHAGELAWSPCASK